MLENIIIRGSCFCSNVSYRLCSKPVLSAYCHCTMCQRLTACPFVHTIHFDAVHFSWTHTSESNQASEPDHIQTTNMDTYTIPSKRHKTRFRCNSCGAVVSSYNSRRNRWSVWGAQLERDPEGGIKSWDLVKPTAHIFYGTRLLDIKDGLGKWDGYEGISDQIAE